MNRAALGILFYQEVGKIKHNGTQSIKEKTEALYRLLNLLFVEMTRREKLHFTTLFARIAYVCHQNQIDKKLEFYIHALRRYGRNLEQHLKSIPEEELFDFALYVINASIEALLVQETPEPLRASIDPNWQWLKRQANITGFHSKIRVVALEIDAEKDQFLVKQEAVSDTIQRVQFNLPERNEHFNPTIEVLKELNAFPIIMNLIDVEVDTEGVLRPRALVIEPDYLMDVSAVSECFKDFGTEPVLFLLKKFLPFTPTKHLLIGNVANFFLDELMHNEEHTFKQLFPKVFQLNPLAFCLFEDMEIREVMQKSQKHYINLKRMVLEEFENQQILKKDCFLEPTFYSETYGLQGRLDVFYNASDREEQAAIVELKSGKAYKPNIYGISSNHFIQTLLYDLIVRSVYGKSINPTNYILYSGLDEKQLRFAPVIKAEQYEALQIRNQLVLLERKLSQLGRFDSPGLLEQGQAIFAKLRKATFPYIKGFIQRDISLFESVYTAMSPLERRYFIAFAGFIAREHLLAKTGVQGLGNVNGLAALWLNKLEEKEESFEIISHLEVHAFISDEDQPLVVFTKTEKTNPLANFRKGDIAVLYPFTSDQSTVLSNQIFKCSIIEIDTDKVVVVLRSRQFNRSFFEANCYWNLEHDLMDGSFNSMYRSLFDFAGQTKEKKQLLLGQRPPNKVSIKQIPFSSDLTSEQQGILNNLVQAEDYFLLWGPPGTGKTSMVLKHAVKHLIEHSQENLLLLAYTNRAVDEICESIESIGQHMRSQYFRIGSRYATSEKFQDQLLNHKTAHCKTRKDLRAVIDQHRIVVATVASLGSKPELLKLKKFDRLMIDEASQILEPMLVGLLSKFDRFVLIGDHKQLPAVVVQDVEASKVTDKSLNELGLHNLRNSLFERLYLRCKSENWDWAYAQLSHQGRMHQAIMEFPNQEFYGGSLNILPEHIPVYQRQVAPITLENPFPTDDLGGLLTGERLLFLATPVDYDSKTRKTNVHEANLIKILLEKIKVIYESNGKAFDAHTVGIITPYRAQIAQIREVLEAADLLLPWLTIDTVERYQGGARSIIIISLCTNALSQLDALISLSEEGVDRKLNVAMTRAKEQLIVLGNPDILNHNTIYRSLIAYSSGVKKI